MNLGALESEANRFELALEDAKASDEFLARAEKFRTERSKAWQEFLEISAEAGYAIEDNLANRSLFMGGYESGKEAASVDRVAVVREAVNEVNKRLDAIEKHRTIRLADYDKAMDAVLAEMEVKNANS